MEQWVVLEADLESGNSRSFGLRKSKTTTKIDDRRRGFAAVMNDENATKLEEFD
jgi:hypothetical protein